MDTIAALASPPGKGGVGMVRVSGPKVLAVARAMCGQALKPRYATYLPFLDPQNVVIDQGIALFFPNPHSYTGEDVLELQGHGGPFVMDQLLQCILGHGVRLAKPGEFTQRAFLNDKMDLAQAESVADLIEASSVQAAQSAIKSLQGAFSESVHALVSMLIKLRLYVEAAIDFPEEEIDFLADQRVTDKLSDIIAQVQALQKSATQGALLRDGMSVVIAGKPNAGKSSLLNALAKKNTAIVTDIAGTTRDVLREYIHLNGVPLHVIDTAGLRDTDDIIEKEGVKRAWDEINQADRILLVVDSHEDASIDEMLLTLRDNMPNNIPVTLVMNKIDLNQALPQIDHYKGYRRVSLSAKNQQGLELLESHLLKCIGFDATLEGTFIARARHVNAINRANEHILSGQERLLTQKAGELLAEELKLAQNALSEITGEFTADDLLGEIFSSFCIGK